MELGEDMDFPCRDHVADIGPSGSTDSTGSDGSDFASRLERYGAVDKYKAESLLFGYTTGE